MASPAPSPSSASSASSSPAADFDPQSCSLCLDPFATEAAGPSISDDRRPRVLGCGHSFCGACLHEDMKRRRCCALCQAPVAQPNAAAVPVNFDLIGAMKAAEGAAAQLLALQRQMEAARVQSPVAVCAECDQPATLFCEQCNSDLCSAHSSHVHSMRMFQSHTVVAMAEKAALLAANQRRDSKARANKCALHSDQIKYLYCEPCEEAVCAVCAHGRHAAHGKIEIAEAAAKARRLFEDELAKVAGSGAKNGGGAGSVNSVGTLADAEKLARVLAEMKQGVLSSSTVARRGVESLCAELKAALDSRCALLVQQLQQQEAAATSVIDPLLAVAHQIAAAGAQLRDEVAAAAASDDYGALSAALRISQLFADMEAQLRALDQQAAAASGPAGCVSSLRLEDGSKAAMLSSLAQLGAVSQLRTKIGGASGSGSPSTFYATYAHNTPVSVAEASALTISLEVHGPGSRRVSLAMRRDVPINVLAKRMPNAAGQVKPLRYFVADNQDWVEVEGTMTPDQLGLKPRAHIGIRP